MFIPNPSNLAGLAGKVYPPCVTNQRNPNSRKNVLMQFEYKKPPLLLTPEGFNQTYGLWFMVSGVRPTMVVAETY